MLKMVKPRTELNINGIKRSGIEYCPKIGIWEGALRSSGDVIPSDKTFRLKDTQYGELSYGLLAPAAWDRI